MICSTSILLAMGALASDAPVQAVTQRVIAAQVSAPEAEAEAPDPLAHARRLSGELRYEEAVVEYQRYLGMSGRPVAERARALIELGFIHLVLGDERNAQARAFEALELDPSLRLPSEAPSRLGRFLSSMREQFEARTVVEVLPPEDPDAPQRIRARIGDRGGRVAQVLLRHAMGSEGPYYAQQMRCEGAVCVGEIPPPRDAAAYTAWYFVEANDAEGNTLARGASPSAPLRVSIVNKAAWYANPWVYAGGAAALVGGAAVFFAVSSPHQ